MTLIPETIQFIALVRRRNNILFNFAILNFAFAVGLFGFSFFIDLQYLGTHAFYKPIKFALSAGIYSLSMAWICSYLKSSFHHRTFSWGVVLLLGFEIVYIAIQASRQQHSHYNVSTSFYSFLYTMMALAAAVVTFWTAYIGFLFCTKKIPHLSSHYLWGLRLGLFTFVIFSFEGFVMGSRMTHTVGAPDGSEGFYFLNWSKTFGDLRISHFLGMHALQILPLSAFYLLKTNRSIILFGFIYFMMTSFALAIALLGKPLL